MQFSPCRTRSSSSGGCSGRTEGGSVAIGLKVMARRPSKCRAQNQANSGLKGACRAYVHLMRERRGVKSCRSQGESHAADYFTI
jgi:hypothetical protein